MKWNDRTSLKQVLYGMVYNPNTDSLKYIKERIDSLSEDATILMKSLDNNFKVSDLPDPSLLDDLEDAMADLAYGIDTLSKNPFLKLFHKLESDIK